MIFLVGFTLGGLLVYIADEKIIPNYNFVETSVHPQTGTTTANWIPIVSEEVVTNPFEPETTSKIIYEPFDPSEFCYYVF